MPSCFVLQLFYRNFEAAVGQWCLQEFLEDIYESDIQDTGRSGSERDEVSGGSE